MMIRDLGWRLAGGGLFAVACTLALLEKQEPDTSAVGPLRGLTAFIFAMAGVVLLIHGERARARAREGSPIQMRGARQRRLAARYTQRGPRQ